VFGVIGRLTAALARLTGGCEGLAETLEQANDRLRSRLTLDGPAEDVPALGHTPPADEPEAEPVAPSRKNGRRG
jgi:NADPH-dependent ferric siderophore reductase